MLKPVKVGFLYNHGNEKNFIFDDLDYYYTTSIFKAQAFYQLGIWKSFDFELIIQPQVQQLKHQLLNEQFVTPEEENYIEKRAQFTKLKTMYLYAFELGFSAKKGLSKKLDFSITIGLGLASIDTETERLAKGFTFIENGSLGFSYKVSNKTALYLGTNFGHISNLDFKSPNNGYNILGIEVGISYMFRSR
ncbi:MAG: acyloxyacyl hydrolase [Polaribacter sp.]